MDKKSGQSSSKGHLPKTNVSHVDPKNKLATPKGGKKK